ncbi:carbohydrate ABC transporter permease [Microlunatus soli]|uniref:Carbohydrate ABC transporter membrane protein 2, CUT1 family n=1 Tax=Microlunatus soli TaxID=630515 RepID=A0A1H1TWS3_9ACTN|nr:carbohydrate ABC transporter permease [Microlunatus soli]SDS64677.1 carbohydrate ABC transporter membrane protein 2, CUT1 family [Microlunatus soli]
MFEIRRTRTRVLLQILLTVLVIPFVFPLVAMVQGSLAGQGWGNYATVLSLPLLPGFFINSAVIAASVIVLVLICTMTASFGFSKLRIRGKEIFFWALLACLTLPGVVLLAPLFATVTRMGAYNTLWAVIIPVAALQVPFTVLLARNFVDGIPDQLMEAARVDGANILKIFWHIMLPLTRPIIAAVGVLVFINSWNEYLFPLLFLQSPEQQTVTLVPSFFIGQYNNDQTKVLAAAVVIGLPIVIAYIFLQKYFERGLAAGALK